MMSNRNSNAHFELAPQVQIERSTFTRDFNVKTSFNVGELVPFYVDEVLPGDTFSVDTSKALRLQTLITPVMDNLYLDFYYFFVPNRLVWEHWQNFMGEDDPQAWTDPVEYSVPQLNLDTGDKLRSGELVDYFGLPTGSVVHASVNALPFRAYCKIWNDWFRDENLQDPEYFPLGDAVTSYMPDSYAYAGGKLLKANKFHDYFTSCLPAPQKGEEQISLLSGVAPVVTNTSDNVVADWPLDDNGRYAPLRWNMSSDPWNFYAKGAINPSGSSVTPLIPHLADKKYTVDHLIPDYRPDDYFSSPWTGVYRDEADYVDNSVYSTPFYESASTANSKGFISGVAPSNLVANLSNATAFSINDLRRLFAIQRMLEKDARGGTRYIELIKAHFGVTSPDARLQRSEYLGGNRVPLNIQQCLQTSESTTQSPLGDVSGWSLTSDTHHDFTKSFTEHGFVIGLAVARYDHTYQQGIERFWSRTSKYDFYWPALAHLGEQAVLNKELYASALSSTKMNEVFGYQEAWAEYRYKPNLVTGEMRSSYAQSLDIWHFADDYESQPYLSAEWIQEDSTNVARTLSVQTQNQIYGDILVSNKCTRPMPLYSIPGLVDHF